MTLNVLSRVYSENLMRDLISHNNLAEVLIIRLLGDTNMIVYITHIYNTRLIQSLEKYV